MVDDAVVDRPKKWIRRIVILLGLLILACVMIVVLNLPRSPEVTPAMQRAAEDALLNPSSAAIKLGVPDHSWYPADGEDFAVESGVVIFPVPDRDSLVQRYVNTISLDKRMKALVYAPDRDTMPSSMNPSIPEDRAFAFWNEWFLYACRPVDDQPGWWLCMLLVGGNI
jgi:hypothetical protein